MTETNSAVAPATESIPAEVFITQLCFGALLSQALHVAAKLGIADLVESKPLPVKELAARTESNERALYRVLRSLASVGVFQETDPGVFGLTPYAELLRTNAPGSFRSGVIWMGEEQHWRVWGHLDYSVKTGKPAWGHVHDEEVFDYFSTHPDLSEIFNRAMTDMSVSAAAPIVEAYDFSQFETVADIAGGHGYLLSQVLKANPNVKGLLFDVTSVIAGADSLLEKQGVADRVEKVAGDFFSSIPGGANAYMMKHIIHDWDDERCIKILSNIRAAMPDDGKVLILEAIVSEGNGSDYAKMLDLEMLVAPGGTERTAREYSDLLAAAGLKLNRIVPTKSPYSVIEAVKA